MEKCNGSGSETQNKIPPPLCVPGSTGYRIHLQVDAIDLPEGGEVLLDVRILGLLWKGTTEQFAVILMHFSHTVLLPEVQGSISRSQGSKFVSKTKCCLKIHDKLEMKNKRKFKFVFLK